MSRPEERLVLAEHPVPEAPPEDRDEARLAHRERLRLLVRSKTFLAGGFLVGVFVFCAILGPAVVPYDPVRRSSRISWPSFNPPRARTSSAPTSSAATSSRASSSEPATSLWSALAATLLGAVLGTVLGLVTGYFRGLVDEVLMRIVDAFLAIPLVILATVALVALGPSKGTLIVVIGIVFAPIIARTVRAAVLSERELEYVEAARLRNERAPYIMFAEILPNVTGPIVVEFTVRLGYAIFAIATLTFLGFGVQPPSPDWGLQIKENYVILNGGYWWPTFFPALAIAALVVGVNLIADGLTQAFER